MILTASFGSACMSAAICLAHYQSLLTAVARAGIDAALFIRSPGASTPMLDAQTLIAALASVPVGIGLGASVPIDYTEPFHLARAFAAIDRLTRGRSAIVADLAAGVDLTAQLGYGMTKAERYAQAEEFFQVTTELWDSWEDSALLVDRAAGLFTDPAKIHRINHDGCYFAVRGPLNAPRPLQGWPVMFMPVASAMSRNLAAQVADVALISCTALEAARGAGAEIREQAAAHGRRIQSIRILVDVEPILGRTEAEARQKAAALGVGGKNTLRFVGTPRHFAALLREWHAADACDGFNLLPPDLPASVDLLAAAVAKVPRMPITSGATLRERLELPRPLSRYAA
jgi:alkanesulfonate monooxygenase SsuD/methylene tetrahydromethanopterin reductase-like flavin-dependent oxidoreductase (luciferase family)